MLFLRTEALGDLEERFETLRERQGLPRARAWYRADVAKSVVAIMVRSLVKIVTLEVSPGPAAALGVRASRRDARPPRTGTILLLGAGASRCAGMPLMLDLTRESYRRLAAYLETPAEIGFERGAVQRVIELARRLDPQAAQNLEALLRLLPALTRVSSYLDPQAVSAVDCNVAVRILTSLDVMVCRVLAEARDPRHPGLLDVRNLLDVVRGTESALDVFSLNFDLCVEDACRMAGSAYTTGFVGEVPRRWRGAALDGLVTGFRLHKLHGSISWRTWTSLDEVPFSLAAHPIVELDDPLAKLERGDGLLSDEFRVGLFPGGKIRLDDPSVSLFGRFLRALERAHTCVVVGYSYGGGDDHVNRALALARADGMFLVDVNPFDPIRYMSASRGIDYVVRQAVGAPQILDELSRALEMARSQDALPGRPADRYI